MITLKDFGIWFLGLINGILLSEYRLWRSRSQRKKELKDTVKNQLQLFITKWERFESADETYKWINPYITDFRKELESLALNLEKTISEIEDLPDEIKQELINISAKIRDMSTHEFLIDGGLSVREFEEKGRKIKEECRKLIKRLR